MQFGTPEPVYTYFWVVVLKDGRTVIPQYDLNTGFENRFGDVPLDQVSKVCWYPFNERLASLAAKLTGKVFVATQNPVLSVDIPEGEVPKVFRRNEQTKYDYYQCKVCGTRQFWDGTGDLACPKCFARNEWFCKKCKKVIDNPLLLKNGEARCPDCEKTGEPNGLNRLRPLELMVDIRHEIWYCLGIEGQPPRIWNDRGEEVDPQSPVAV